MSSNLIDTEAGGETSQYESIQTVNKPPSKQGGQLSDQKAQTNEATSQEQQVKTERGERTPENLRYGQAISEQGMGGQTIEVNGVANRDGFGSTDSQTNDIQATETRQEQGYGSGSGVGA